MERKQSTNTRSKKYNLEEPSQDICVNDEAAYVTPWDRRLSRTVYFKRDPKNSSCSMLTDEQKEYLLRPLSDEYECSSEFLSLANSWNFPIFKFNDSTEHCLSLVRVRNINPLNPIHNTSRNLGGELYVHRDT